MEKQWTTHAFTGVMKPFEFLEHPTSSKSEYRLETIVHAFGLGADEWLLSFETNDLGLLKRTDDLGVMLNNLVLFLFDL